MKQPAVAKKTKAWNTWKYQIPLQRLPVIEEGNGLVKTNIIIDSF
jgi:hypothetical protein